MAGAGHGGLGFGAPHTPLTTRPGAQCHYPYTEGDVRMISALAKKLGQFWAYRPRVHRGAAGELKKGGFTWLNTQTPPS